MKPLVLTSWLIPDFIKSGFADLAVHFFYRFIWGPLPPTAELAAYLGPRGPEQHSGTHWSAFAYGWERSRGEAHRNRALAEFCLDHETVELWFDTRPSINPLFHLQALRQTRVFDETEHGYLLDGLAFGSRPAIAGLDDELRTIRRDNLRDRHRALLRSRLSLTEFGKAVVAYREDFSRHNPIDRWWGGTHLTNDNLWRYGRALTRPQGEGA